MDIFDIIFLVLRKDDVDFMESGISLSYRQWRAFDIGSIESESRDAR